MQYAFGLGVKQSYKEAADWYRKSAEQGNDLAQRALGLCYSKGEGVERSDQESVKWLKLSADQNNSDAQYDLGEALEAGKVMWPVL